MAILKVENLSTGYGKKQVLFNVSFDVNKGDIVLVAGSNGSGKSTLLRAIYGLLPQWDDGRVLFDGEDITGKPTSVLLKKGLLYIPQKNNLFEDLTVKENLEMAGLTIESKMIKERLDTVLSLFTTVTSNLNRTPMTLSGGERQLLILAMASLHKPMMILFDEPFAGLSPKNIELFSENLRYINKANQITLLIVEHRIKKCVELANKVVGMKLGKVHCELNAIKVFDDKVFEMLFV